MAQKDAVEQLKDRFAKPLEEFEQRRVVFWHDVDGSFEDEFESLAKEGIPSERTVRFLKLSGSNRFVAKRELYRLHAGDDFLVYTTEPKDFSPKTLEKNWLADIEICSEHFQADFASLLAESLGAKDAAIEGVSMFRQFFNAADRRARFVKLMPQAETKADVALGVIGATLGASDLSLETIVRTYLVLLCEGSEPLDQLSKYGADSLFASLVSKRIGYNGDLLSRDDFAAHLLLTALSTQLPSEFLEGLEGRISIPHGQPCLNVVRAWMGDEKSLVVLFELARDTERLCGLPKRFSEIPLVQLQAADVFPCVNECILASLLGSMAQGADRFDEALQIAQRRKDLKWFSRVEPYFSALEASAHMQRFYREHAQGFHVAVARDVWCAYTGEWRMMDFWYRTFCSEFDRCGKSSFDIAGGVTDELENLAAWVEGVYVNWFLSETNRCWVNAAENQWSKSGYIEGVPRQRRFFDEFVLAGSGDVKRTLVIISDALRFEVADELAQRLERATAGTAELKSMQGVFPSVTEFGMAALLPHNSMGLRESDMAVFLDGGVPVASTEEREAALRRRKPKGRCIQSKTLLAAKRSARKQLVGDADVVYVYHNKIDAVGEDFNTEHMVFDACETAIEDLVALVKSSVNDLNISRVLITADHGFLYTRNPLEERSKVSAADASARVVKQGRRYLVSDEPGVDDVLFVKMNMDDIDGGAYTGLAPRECVRIKKAGPGDNYVHGGLSLQECCVPVVEFRNRRSGAKGFEERQRAGFKLLSTSRRITSMLFHVELFQTEAVGGKILPAEYEITLLDASGNAVSDTRPAHADMATTDETVRVSRIQLGLKAGRQYDPKKPYYLSCRSKDDGSEAWRQEFSVEIAFVPMDDFDF